MVYRIGGNIALSLVTKVFSLPNTNGRLVQNARSDAKVACENAVENVLKPLESSKDV